MKVKLRLQRFGSNKRPYYRIVAATNTRKRDGQFLEIVGLYHPVAAEDSQVRLDKEKVNSWLEKGAEPTLIVKNILKREKVWSDFAQAKEARRVKRAAKDKARRKARAAKKQTAQA